MISFSLMGRYGRLGNQMFQYACAYALARKHNTNIGISSTDLYRSAGSNQLIETFELANAIIDKFENIKYTFEEVGFEYDSRIELISDGTDIRGYFQSERYFSHIRNELINCEFKFKSNIDTRVNSIWSSYFEGASVCSIHIRCGDYKRLADTHYNLGIEYYSKALSLVPKCDLYAVFSDDLILASDLISSISGSPIGKFIYPDFDYGESLSLMSRCDHHIIANSSYSWWGSWLSRNTGTTIAPKNWFGPAGPKSWNSIYCKKWIVI
jgi:hypothetical protein